jgi:hypothetical protein
LYCLLTGRPPFQSATAYETLRQVREDELAAPRQLNVGVPPDLETVCLKCLQKEPAKRYGSARELAEELGRFERGEPVRARPVGWLERGWRWCRRNPTVAGLLGAVAALLVAGTTISTLFALDAAEKEGIAKEKADEAEKNATLANDECTKAEGLAEERAKALEELTKEKAKVQEGLAKAEFVVYAFRLREAQGEIERGRLDDAVRVLRLCDPKLRNWEHDYLLYQTHRCVWSAGKHDRLVSSVAFHPDGGRIASGSEDKMVRVWDARTGKELLTLTGHGDPVRGVAFSPDGGRIASGSDDKTVKVWDTGTGQEALTLMGHAGGITSVAFSPDGMRLASGSLDKTVKVWDARTGKELLTLTGHAGGVTSVAFSPDGGRIASGSEWAIKVFRLDKLLAEQQGEQ